MGFADDIQAEHSKTHPCRVDQVRQKMSKSDLKVFDAALEDMDGVSTGAIIRALQKDPEVTRMFGGKTLGRHALLKHRNKTCVCYQEGLA